MIRAIDQLHLEIDQRVAGDRSRLRGFDDSFLNSRAKLLRHRTTKDLVFKQETTATRQRFKDALAISELSATTGLLLMATLHFSSLGYRFLVRDLGRMQRYFHAITFLQFFHHCFDVQLP